MILFIEKSYLKKRRPKNTDKKEPSSSKINKKKLIKNLLKKKN